MKWISNEEIIWWRKTTSTDITSEISGFKDINQVKMKDSFFIQNFYLKNSGCGQITTPVFIQNFYLPTILAWNVLRSIISRHFWNCWKARWDIPTVWFSRIKEIVTRLFLSFVFDVLETFTNFCLKLRCIKDKHPILLAHCTRTTVEKLRGLKFLD